MSVATLIDGMLKRERNLARWVPYYTGTVSLIGLGISLAAFINYDGKWGALALFVGVAFAAQVSTVRLFAKSHIHISMGYVIAIAAMITFGPWGGVLTQLAAGTASEIMLSFRQPQPAKTQRASFLQRWAFNISMGAISLACGALVFLSAGGVNGSLIHWNMLLPLSMAVIIDNIVNMVLLMVVIRLQTGRKVSQVWLEDWRWAMPIFILSGVIGGGGLTYAYTVAGAIGISIFMLPVVATGYAFHLYVSNTRAYVDQLEAANKQLEDTNFSLLHTLGSVIDAYDIYTFGHSAQVARYAEAIAEAMHLPASERALIVRGGLIHDVGKIGVTDAIIGKQGRLTDEEYEALKLHTVIGAEIVSQMPQLHHLVPLVRNHHERWDGRGYPDGLKQEETPLGARILAVADSVEAMLSDRPYRATRSLEDVVEEVVHCSGRQFDPAVVTAFLTVAKERGSQFFINSASAVTQELQQSGAGNSVIDRCYVKRSMLPKQLANSITKPV